MRFSAFPACSPLVFVRGLFAAVKSLPPVRCRTGGNARHGRELTKTYGCGACHIVPGVTGRERPGRTSASLFSAARTMIAGELPNSPENLDRWIENPLAIEPGTAMPDLGLDRG